MDGLLSFPKGLVSVETCTLMPGDRAMASVSGTWICQSSLVRSWVQELPSAAGSSAGQLAACHAPIRCAGSSDASALAEVPLADVISQD